MQKDEDLCPAEHYAVLARKTLEPIKSDVLEAFRDGRPNQQEITRLHHTHTGILYINNNTAFTFEKKR